MDKEYLSKSISKEQLYRIYEAVNDDYKPYDKITRRKMLDSIEIRYQDPNIMKSFITDNEFSLLRKLYKNKTIKKSYLYQSLYERLMVVDDSEDSFKINPELIEVLKPYLVNEVTRDGYDRYDEIIIGLVNYFGVLTYEDIFHYIEVYTGKFDEETMFDHISTSPIINYLFLCPTDYVLCRYDLFEYLDEIIENRKQVDTSVVLPEIHQLINIGAYGMDIENPEVKEMFDIISTLNYYQQCVIFYWMIHDAHLNKEFNDLIFKVRDFSNKQIDIIEKGYMNLPCSSHYGLPLKFHQVNLDEHFDLVEDSSNNLQGNAHLSHEDAELFYKLYMSLLEYINDKYHVCPEIKKIYGVPIDPNDVSKIRMKLVEHPEIVDRFIHNKKCNLNDEEKQLILDFKYCKFAHFVICKHEKDYTLLMDGEDFYAVIGARSNISEMMNHMELPTFSDTLLLQFKGKIVSDGVIATYPIQIGKGFNKVIYDQLKTAKIIHQLKKFN